ncbi:MAG: hypothetical protein M1827_001185 [Pycnora praestabilis]|nr:MAG: hypothetical protein M1827_001185 [Pycnora praestabilis]
MPSAVILLADGTEEIEFVTPYDVLVRAGFDVKSAGVDLKNSTHAMCASPSATHPPPFLADVCQRRCSRGVRVMPDMSSIAQVVALPDILILPGGAPGAAAFCKNDHTLALIQRCRQEGKWMGFICAGTTALVEAAVRAHQPWKNRVTSHPSVKQQIVEKDWEYAPDTERVVVDGKVITSRGPGTALLFALKIVECLMDNKKRDEVAGPMLCAEVL